MLIYEWGKEWLFKGQLNLWQSHSITILFVAILASACALMVGKQLLRISELEKALSAKQAGNRSYVLMLSASQHILNNFLNHFQLVRMEADSGNGQISAATLAILEESIREAQQQMGALNSIQEPADPDSYAGVYPKTHNWDI